MTPPTWRVISLAEVEHLCPAALVIYDRDVAERLSDPVFLLFPEGLMVCSQDEPDDCWSWSAERGQWDDDREGSWAPAMRAHIQFTALPRLIADAKCRLRESGE